VEKPHFHGQRNTRISTATNTMASSAEGVYPHRLLYGYTGSTPSTKSPTAISSRISTFTGNEASDRAEPGAGPVRIPMSCRHRDAVEPCGQVPLLDC
jgi:hypothetical protein